MRRRTNRLKVAEAEWQAAERALSTTGKDFAAARRRRDLAKARLLVELAR